MCDLLILGRTITLIATATAAGLLLPTPSPAQTAPAPGAPRPTPVRTVLASTPLPSVVDVPLHYKLLRVSVPVGQSTSYTGPHGFIYQMSGALLVTSGSESRTLRAGDAMFVGAGRTATLKAAGNEPAVLLHFLLLSAADLDRPAEGEPAVVAELYRTPPLPGLKPGPYEFTLTRVAFPPQMPSNPPHYRSGGALYYVVSGTGVMTVDGKPESKPAGARIYEPYGLVHQWGNPGESQLVLLQANISPEGVPAVIMGTPPASR